MQLGKNHWLNASPIRIWWLTTKIQQMAPAQLAWTAQSGFGSYGEKTFFEIANKGESLNFEQYEWAWMAKATKRHTRLLDVYCLGFIASLGSGRFPLRPESHFLVVTCGDKVLCDV